MANVKQRKIYNLPDDDREAVTRAITRLGKLKVVGLGIFEVRLIPARMGRNPKTGAVTEIGAYYKIKFRPTKSLKDAVAAHRA